MDFVSDALADGRPFRSFALVDDFTRECPAREVSHSLPALRVIQVLQRLASVRGLPRSIVCDNGPEFAGRTLDYWAHERGVELQFIRPGKPIENAVIESFNGKLCNECLSVNWFTTLRDAQQTVEAWRHDYNTIRPHLGRHSQSPTTLLQTPNKPHRHTA